MILGEGTVCGYFTTRAAAGAAMRALREHGFSTVQCSEVAPRAARRTGVADFVRACAAAARTVLPAGPRDGFYGEHELALRQFAVRLRDAGLHRDDVDYFGKKLREGGALVTVRAFHLEGDAHAILVAHGADMAGMELEPSSDPVPGPATLLPSDGLKAPADGERLHDEAHRLELREERIEIDKQFVDDGEVTVRKVLVQEMQTFEVPVMREELVIERRSAGGVGNEEIRRVPLSHEEVRINKKTVVTENVVVGKRVVEEQQTFSETLAHDKLPVR